MTNYLAQVTPAGNNGCYRMAGTLDEIRVWAKTVGKPGDALTILRNGDKLGNARVIII